MILISFTIVVIFNITSADFVLMSASVVLKMTTILKENEDRATVFLQWTDFSLISFFDCQLIIHNVFTSFLHFIVDTIISGNTILFLCSSCTSVLIGSSTISFSSFRISTSIVRIFDPLPIFILYPAFVGSFRGGTVIIVPSPSFILELENK